MPDLSRRDFLAAGAGALALSLVESPGRADERKAGMHHIPEDKNLSKEWLDALFAKGKPKVYKGEELNTIGMPIGGICAGQLYLRGDGTLAEWDIFNHDHFTGYGDNCYRTYTPPSPVDQGFGVWVKPRDGEAQYRTLDKKSFPKVEFVGEYPIGTVHYALAADDPLPLDITLEVFSPFIPLDARASGTPGTVLKFTLKNTSKQPVDAALGGWLQNVVGSGSAGRLRGECVNAVERSEGMTTLLLTAKEAPAPPPDKIGEPEVFADFEDGTYGQWKKTGDCFGDKPAMGTLPNQQEVTGYGGKYLVNTFVGGDKTTGTLTSPEFTINRPYIYFKIGGGNFPGRECINLKVVGKVVRTATGKNQEKLEWDYWEVSDLKDKKAVLEIVDLETGGWGHINIDDITFGDAPPKDAPARPFKEQRDFGTLALSVLDAKATVALGSFEAFRKNGELETEAKLPAAPLGKGNTGGLATRVTLQPGATKEVVFLLTWHFPNNEHGRMYGDWFADAVEVARYLRENLNKLTKQTHLFHDAYYDSTLPHWLLDRLLMPVSTLATSTVQWWKNGRFWAWEGVGCCHGTCTHVWNYAQAVARLFPELERSARTMQDLGPALDPKTGRVAFRGEGQGYQYAADGQCGTVLKSYREHLMSKDGSFLKAHWPKIKKVMEYSISRDGATPDGIIEDNQHNTYDIDFVGPNTFVGALYLAALEAAARMAELQGDKEFATQCRAIAGKGSKWTVEHLWNGEYFTQEIPKGKEDKFQYGDGCLADQVFGQFWAEQCELGYVYPADKVRTALKSVYRYNWAPDIAAQNKEYPPQRWFARPGDAGLFTCTWPKGGRMKEPVLYRDEIWTGIEYQVAAAMIHEGMIREGLSIIRGVHDRYDGEKHNPWNEVECGDHYARAMASWGCLLALAGFTYDGPAGKLGFAPRWQQEDFKAFFSAAEGWGSLKQKRREKSQENGIEVRHGRVTLKQLVLEAPETVKVTKSTLREGEKDIDANTTQEGQFVKLTLAETLVLEAGKSLVAQLEW
jgi:non-lysosomal glucosylceramidase